MANGPATLSSAVAGADARAKALKLADAGDFEDDAILAWLGAHQLHRGRLHHLVIGDEPLPARASAKAIVLKTAADADALLKTATKDAHAMGVLTKLAHKPGSGLKPKASKAEVLANLSARLVSGDLWAIRPARGQRRGGSPITADLIRMIMLGAGSKADDFVDALNAAMTKHKIASDEQMAAFLAQISVESGDLHKTEENLNYSAARLMAVWPTRFRTLKDATPYAHNPEALANHVYHSRNGNGNEASGDGYLFRGRGLMQTTGRTNYRAIGHEADPASLTTPSVASETAAAFWEDHGLNASTSAVLDRKAFDAVTRTVNGALTDAQKRWDAYLRALDAMGVPH